MWLINAKNRRTRARRRELDAAFRDDSLRALAPPPDGGWIREIRHALGMSGRELAARMGLSQPALSQLEQSEVTGKAQLDSLRRAADALGCDLFYALAPRTSLEETVQARARALAERDLAGAAMPEGSVDHYAARLAEGGRLWDDRDPG